MWSQPADIDATTVVSEIGEQWSPKTPPPMTAATASGTDAPAPTASGTAIGMRIAKVPHELPVEKEITQPVTKTRGATVVGLRIGAIASAIEHQKTFGNPVYKKNDHLRSVFEVRHCKKCGQHWVRFSVEKQSGDDWKEIPELTVGGFTDQVVNV